MLTRQRIAARASQDGVDVGVAERDYVLAHIVSQLPASPLVTDGAMLFKGGGVLRYVHFGRRYRYSADLDFTLLEDATTDDGLAAIDSILEATREFVRFPLLERFVSDDKRNYVRFVGPLRREGDIKLEIAPEVAVEGEVSMAPQAVWDDQPEVEAFPVYDLSEIGAEKLRCVIQRVQGRDLYDLRSPVGASTSLR